MAGLKITRKVGQGFSAFMHGVEIKIIFEQVRGSRVGVFRIIAPESVKIFRDELLEEGYDDDRASNASAVGDPSVAEQKPVALATQSVSAKIQTGDVG